jgi:membrane protein DedA with SNARE-associated domain
MPHALSLHTVSHYAAAIIFVNLSCGIFGVPAMTEALLIVAGVLSTGDGSLVAPFSAAVLGSTVGMTTSFGIGSRIRRRSTSRALRVRVISSALGRATMLSRRFGSWSIVLGYFTPGLRHFAAAAAGAADMDRRRFAAVAIAGASLWAGLLLLTGRVTGDIHSAAAVVHHWYAAGAAAAVAAVLFGSLRAKARPTHVRPARRHGNARMRIAIALAVVAMLEPTVSASAHARALVDVSGAGGQTPNLPRGESVQRLRARGRAPADRTAPIVQFAPGSPATTSGPDEIVDATAVEYARLFPWGSADSETVTLLDASAG